MRKSLVLTLAVIATNAVFAEQELPKNAICRLGAVDDPLRGVYLAAFSPDGRYLATRGRDQKVRLWDVETGKERFAFSGHVDRITSLAFSMDGKVLATTSPGTNEAVRLWDTATGKNRYDLKHGGTIVQFLPDGKTLVVVNTGQIVHYDAKAFQRKSTNDLSLSPSDTPLALSTDAKSIICYRSRGGRSLLFDLFIQDIATSAKTPLAGLKQMPVAGRFSPDGQQLTVACRREQGIHIFDFGATLSHGVRNGHDGPTQSITYSTSGRLMATASWDKTVRLWDVLTGEVLAALSGHSEHVCAVAFSADGKRLASGASGPTDNSTIVWDVQKVIFGDEPPDALSNAELSELWDQLAAEPAVAFRAMAKLVHDPSKSFHFLKDRVTKLVPAADPTIIERLIRDLDSDEFKVRDEAQRKLTDLRVIAESLLQKTLAKTDSFEVRSRIKQILATKKSEKQLSEPERRQIHRLIHVLELIGTDAAKQQLITIKSGFPNAKVITAASASVERIVSANANSNESP